MKNIHQRLKKYATAGLAFLAGTGSNAAVVYTDITDFNGTVTDSYDIDLDNNGVMDFQVYGASSYYKNLYLRNFDVTGSALGFVLGSGSFVQPYALSSGEPINASAANWGNAAYYYNGYDYLGFMSLNYYSGSAGYWVNVVDKYLGLRFDISGSIHYGWVRMSVSGDASAWVIKDYAYEDCAGVGLGAGQTGGGCGTSCTPPVNTFDITNCDSATVFGQTFFSSQIARDTLFGLAANGCDSILEANIIISTTNYTTDSVSACGPYTWVNGITYTESNDTAQYVFTNSQGCDSTVTLKLDITTMDNTVATSLNQVTANEDSASYNWLDCDNGMTAIGVTTQTYTVTSNGNYAVELTQNTCVDTSACVTVAYDYMKEEQLNMFTILPNPASGPAVIRFSEHQNEPKQVIIYNASGVEVLSTRTNESQLFITDLPPTGMYQVMVKSSKGVQIMKLIIL